MDEPSGRKPVMGIGTRYSDTGAEKCAVILLVQHGSKRERKCVQRRLTRVLQIGGKVMAGRRHRLEVDDVLRVQMHATSTDIAYVGGVVLSEYVLHAQVPLLGIRILHMVGQEARGVGDGSCRIQHRDAAAGFSRNSTVGQECSLADRIRDSSWLIQSAAGGTGCRCCRRARRSPCRNHRGWKCCRWYRVTTQIPLAACSLSWGLAER